MNTEPPIVIRPAIRAFYGRLLIGAALLAGGLYAPTAAAGLARQESQLLRDLAGASFNLPGLGETGIGTLGMLLGIAGALGMAAWIMLSRYYYTWQMHPEYLHASVGLVANKQRALYYDNARIPTIRRGIIDRLLMVGSLEVSSSGAGGEGDFRMVRISNPVRLKRSVMERIEAARGR
ncbi:hypothetical protein TK90_2621 (plasmid) [Thioalkalivibrio sp. K90mix]|uniref:hypothetical protein n=1 Tax=Thioalkalivibrio sp. (strain K90mix) TaxID=396595 RepID=UPI000195AB27|nr:hypothetical protein [Thioalkalivibrio sp. K90mix]ADC73108.1 hypothetical protein TK90_2621 [Thioalkalivibrio sp. K90mix]